MGIRNVRALLAAVTHYGTSTYDFFQRGCRGIICLGTAPKAIQARTVVGSQRGVTSRDLVLAVSVFSRILGQAMWGTLLDAVALLNHCSPPPPRGSQMLKQLIYVTLVLAPICRLHAQIQSSDSLLGRLIGTWVLRGDIARKQVVHDVTCQWVLNREYVQMREVSRKRRADGAPDYEAIVYIGRDPQSKQYAALWLDNTAYGAFAPAGTGHAYANGDSIPFVFTDSPTSHVFNTFIYHRSTDAWESHIDNEAAGARKPFARVTLTRK